MQPKLEPLGRLSGSGEAGLATTNLPDFLIVNVATT